MKIETETAIVPFDFNGAQIRVIRDDKGEPWFVAKDVCECVGIEGLLSSTRDLQWRISGEKQAKK